MTLLELLVRELPKRGGWPEGAVECERFIDEATIDFYDWCGNWPVDCGEKYGAIAVKCIKPREAGDGYRKENVKKEEYEAALAASKRPEWGGEGLPPVGTKCEWQDKNTKAWLPVIVVYASEWVSVIREDKEFDAVEIAIENYGDEARRQFRKTLNEADRKRDEAIAAMRNFATNYNNTAVIHAIEQVYDSIAAGKIPHINLK
ncbi:hypothetical protein [Pantoea stewartii]|uniref:hypothetical protein n=1 Tax=Pantoea stewartii TaxID=66269 RepID=UPI00197F3DE0|nr:hypothetical protein [Pantoea stewartii]